MPKMVLTAAYLSLDGSDVSDHTSKIQLTAEIEEKDVTTYKSQGWKEVTGGLASGSLAVTFKQNYDAAAIDAKMWALFLGRLPVSFEVRAMDAAAGPNNPSYSGKTLVRQWNPLAGTVGDVAESDVTWPTSGPITRAAA